MEIEFYDEEEHDYFLEAYRQYSRSPNEGEKQFFRSLIEEIVNEISGITGVSADFKLYFAVTKESSLDDDLPINRYVHGFSFADFMEGFDRDVIMIRAVRGREDWKACLINMLAHEMAHQQYYDFTNKSPYKVWENLIMEGHAMNTAEKVANELNLDWRPHYRSDEEIEIESETVFDLFDKNRSYESEDIFKNGEKPCPNAEGYNIAYQAVKYVTGVEDVDLQELLEIDEKKQRRLLEESLKDILI